ncbi:MAG: transcriptional repressor [Candidatus Zixiibacteriota bacterium]|jgi:Fur family ferric uptake transcriptional regulator
MVATGKLKMTAQRRVIIEELRKNKSHPTADQLFLLVRKRLPDISMATVYRNLDILAEHGLVQKLWEGEGPRRYNGTVTDHYHVYCEHCGRLDDVPLEAVNGFLQKAQALSDYDIRGYRLEFYGVCPDCQAEEAEA